MKTPNKLFLVYSFDKPSKALLSRDITCFIGSEDVVKDIEGETTFIISGEFN
jgi:medium-chain acyl-[acyl-carrier-protein] hydrolase